jgi:hypothetical protein
MAEGMTLREACVYAVAILGDLPGTPDVVRFLRGDGWPVTRASVRATLSQLCGAAVEVAVQGQPGYGHPTRWRLTEAARSWIGEGVCCG